VRSAVIESPSKHTRRTPITGLERGREHRGWDRRRERPGQSEHPRQRASSCEMQTDLRFGVGTFGRARDQRLRCGGVEVITRRTGKIVRFSTPNTGQAHSLCDAESACCHRWTANGLGRLPDQGAIGELHCERNARRFSTRRQVTGRQVLQARHVHSRRNHTSFRDASRDWTGSADRRRDRPRTFPLRDSLRKTRRAARRHHRPPRAVRPLQGQRTIGTCRFAAQGGHRDGERRAQSRRRRERLDKDSGQRCALSH